MNRAVICGGITLVFIFLVKVAFVHAGTLSCTVRSGSCNEGEISVWRMSGTSNAHAELATQSNYTNLICCTGVTGLDRTCSGTNATIIKLSGTSNAHAEQSSQSLYSENVCLSVPSGGTITAGYQSSDCTGYDTTLGSISGVTNAHVGDGSAYTTKICATATGPSGTLTVDIVDTNGDTVLAPSMPMNAVSVLFTSQSATGTFGVAAQKIRVDNSTGNAQWSLTLAAADGPTSVWDSVSGSYDFNDATADAMDGADTDNRGGQMTVNATPGILGGTCTDTGITKGASAQFVEGVTDSITILTAGALADISCYWDMTGVSVSQTIPKEQSAATDYNIDMMLTVTAI